MTIPAGSPLWTRTSTAATYGGTASKRNYGGIGAVNANTDVTAEQYIRLAADAAAAAMMAPLCFLRLTYNGVDTVSLDNVLPCWAPPWLPPYPEGSAPSAVYPSATITGATQVTIHMPATAADAYGVAAAISVLFAVPLKLGTFWVSSVDPTLVIIDGLTAGAANVCPVMVF